MNNFEDEGSSLWNLNSPNEEIQDSITRRGIASVQHKRSFDSPNNIITDLEQKIPINNNLNHTIHGFIRTKNGSSKLSCPASSIIPKALWHKRNKSKTFDNIKHWMGAGEFLNFYFAHFNPCSFLSTPSLSQAKATRRCKFFRWHA